LIEEGAVVENTDATHAWFRDFRNYYQGFSPQALTVGEVWSQTTAASSYAQGNELDLTFDFDLAQALVLSSGLGNAYQINTTLATDLRLYKPGQFAAFLSNHDQVRVMSVLNGQADRAKLAATLLLSGPGAPFIYYGEEIGMLGKKPDEDLRRPMQWSNEANAGFTTGKAWHALNDNWPADNVAAETAKSDSLLSHYRRLIDIRSQHAALRVGDTFIVDGGNRAVFAALRVSKHEAVLVLINLGNTEIGDYSLNLVKSPLAGTYTPAAILGEGELARITVNGRGGFKTYKPLAKLAAFGSYLIQLTPGP
jgi:alpha-amylase